MFWEADWQLQDMIQYFYLSDVLYTSVQLILNKKLKS